MKKLIILILGLLLSSGLFAKQYLYTVIVNTKVISTNIAINIKNDMEKAVFDLIIRGYKIIEIIPTIADGYTIGYTILYEDNK